MKAKTRKGSKLDGLDGEMGRAKEYYFDNRHWTIRYLFSDRGNWLMDRQTLISPFGLVAAIKEDQNVAINLIEKQSLEYTVESLRYGIMKSDCIDIMNAIEESIKMKETQVNHSEWGRQ